MKKLVIEDEQEGLMSLLGEKVLLMTSGYFYTGKLIGVNDSCVKLEDPAIVYETGAWADKKYSNEQSMCKKFHYVSIGAIESFGESK